jgi:endoglucanase
LPVGRVIVYDMAQTFAGIPMSGQCTNMRTSAMVIVMCLGTAARAVAADSPVHIRVNQVGYLPGEVKVGVAFSDTPVTGTFSLVDNVTGQVAFTGEIAPSPSSGWNGFAHYYWLDYSRCDVPGRYRVRVDATGELSRSFAIDESAYGDYVEDLLRFLRQQRCGYNPVLGCVCHQRDGRTAYGPLPPGTFVDARGGWHDAGDQLKYLMTGSNATARMLLAFELSPTKFDDRVDEVGRCVPNGVADVLDEARWGLEWLLKLHPQPNQLFHQVADDRDHLGWKLPDQDPSDYGWGPRSYRVLYFADGQPQGLRAYQSEATGVANLAGRCAAALAAAHRIWTLHVNEPAFAARCLQAATELYAMGKTQEGYQQGNSYGAPYRYLETTWADDMEWAAAELFRETNEPAYRNDAIRYAQLAADTSWMPRESAGHYQYYPFVNVGHFTLYPHVDATTQAQLASYYRAGIEATVARAQGNAFRAGVPFIWCSNNLTTALVTQILLYERMTGDTRYHGHLLAQRDWLFGCNPWGTTMFTGIPRDGEFPEDVHTSTWKLTRRAVAGGLVDGPVYATVYNSLRGLELTDADEFAAFQTAHVVYHDDIGDYSTNEPTMDGTADAIWMVAHFGVPPQQTQSRAAHGVPAPPASCVVDAGGIRRGPPEQKRLALVFTADQFVEGADAILETLDATHIRASFFLTGNALAAPHMRAWARRAVAAGHYLGPHSHGHLPYASWDERARSLVDKQRLQADLYHNLADLRDLGAARQTPVYFVPPFAWYNADHVDWAKELGCQLVSFTPGSGSQRDFAPEGHQAFRPSLALIREILDYEAHADAGLNGHLLLLHLGSARQDKFHPHLGELIEQLRARGYTLVRIDELLRKTI